jgi:hypothetical protein
MLYKARSSFPPKKLKLNSPNFVSMRCLTPQLTKQPLYSKCFQFSVPYLIARRSYTVSVAYKPRYSRSQWPSGLRHELSSLVRTLGSWVQILLKAWMSVCVYSVFVLFCVYVAALRWAEPPVQGILPTVCRIKKLKKRPRSNRGL